MTEKDGLQSVKQPLVKCNKCNGTGGVVGSGSLATIGKILKVNYPCQKCKGTGMVDWVKQVTWRIEDVFPEAKSNRKTGGTGPH